VDEHGALASVVWVVEKRDLNKGGLPMKNTDHDKIVEKKTLRSLIAYSLLVLTFVIYCSSLYSDSYFLRGCEF